MERSSATVCNALSDQKLISLRELAQIFNLSEVQTRRLVRAGKTPSPIRLNTKKLGFRVGDVRKFLDSKAGA